LTDTFSPEEYVKGMLVKRYKKGINELVDNDRKGDILFYSQYDSGRIFRKVL